MVFTSVRHFNDMISIGSVRSLFLCNINDFRCLRLAMAGGKLSSELSLKFKAFKLSNIPKVTGTSDK